MNLKKILEKHKMWLNGYEGGEKANLRGANLRGANLSGTNLRKADLSQADLSDVDLSDADLREADLTESNANRIYLFRADLSGVNLSNTDLADSFLHYANLSNADLTDANLSNAVLCGADLSGVNLSNTDLTDADLLYTNLSFAIFDNANLKSTNLNGADIRNANLSGAVNILSQSDYIKENFEAVDEGIIVYKIFNAQYPTSEKWVIQQGSVITENVNFDRCNDCACGINVATLDWIRNYRQNSNIAIWKCLIRWEWLSDICVPYNTDGKIRCEKVELLEIFA